MDINELLAFCVKNRGTDLHLSPGSPPLLRIYGDIRRLDVAPVSADEISEVLNGLMTQPQRTIARQSR